MWIDHGINYWPGGYWPGGEPKPRGNRKQRRLTATRRIQRARRWYKHAPELREMTLGGEGGGIFGVSISTDPPGGEA